jgi:hypothetical protein
MPYRTIENMTRRGEKIAPFLTIENLVGLLISGTLGYVLKASLEGVWQFAFMAGCMGLGYLATLEVQGIVRYQRVIWRLRGSVASLVRGRALTPTDLPGSALQRHVTVVRLGGSVRLRPDTVPDTVPITTVRIGAARTPITADFADIVSEQSEEPDVYPRA